MGAGLITRLRNFVSDKNANIPITSSYVDNELNQIVASLNSKALSSASAPVSPTIGDTWIDTANLLIKFYNGSTWDTLLYLTSVLNQLKSTDIASATTTDLATATGNYVIITGTTTITGFGTVAAGTQMVLKFDGILTLTYNGTSLILPSGANITTAAGDVAGFVSLGSGNWRCMWYQRASGQAVISSVAAGMVLQMVNGQTASVITCSTALPFDDTIPQNNEGNEIITVAITPSSSSNKLRIDAVVSGSVSSDGCVAIALFQDTTAGALAVAFNQTVSGTDNINISLTHYMDAGTTSATTFKIRGGKASGTFYANGASAGTRLYGGVSFAQITVTEIKV